MSEAFTSEPPASELRAHTLRAIQITDGATLPCAAILGRLRAIRGPVLFAAKKLVPALIAASFMTAPFQCARKIDPDRRLEDEPAEVLFALAEKFKAEGNPAARAETLRFLVARYPASRFAEMAKSDLAELPPK